MAASRDPGRYFDLANLPAGDPTDDSSVASLEAQQANPVLFPATGQSFSVVGHSIAAVPSGHPLLVSSNQLVFWENANSNAIDDGSRPLVVVNHYNNNAAGIDVRYLGTTYNSIRVSPIIRLLDFTSPDNPVLPGKQVAIPPTFSNEARLWKILTFEKTSANSMRAIEFKLNDGNSADIDRDGIVSLLENNPYVVVPGSFTYPEAQADALLRGGVLAQLGVPAALASAQTAVRYRMNLEAAEFGTRIPLPVSGLWIDGPQYLSRALAVMPGGSPTQLRGGYLMVREQTDPFEADIDGDNLVDGAELEETLTSATAANFAFGAPTVPDFTDPTLLGNFEGIVHGPLGTNIGVLSLRISRGGRYSGKLIGPFGSLAARGTFSAAGTTTVELRARNGSLAGTMQTVQEGGSGSSTAISPTPRYSPAACPTGRRSIGRWCSGCSAPPARHLRWQTTSPWFSPRPTNRRIRPGTAISPCPPAGAAGCGCPATPVTIAGCPGAATG